MATICWPRVVRSWAALSIGSTDGGLEGTLPLPDAFRRAASQLAGELNVEEAGLLIPETVEPKLEPVSGGGPRDRGCVWGLGQWGGEGGENLVSV